MVCIIAFPLFLTADCSSAAKPKELCFDVRNEGLLYTIDISDRSGYAIVANGERYLDPVGGDISLLFGH